MSKPIKTCVAVFSSPLGLSLANKYEHVFRERVAEALGGVEYVGVLSSEGAEIPVECDLLVGLVATGGTEHIVLSAAERVKHLILAYHEYYNSLAATSEVVPALREKGVYVSTVPFTDIFTRKLRDAFRAHRTISRLRGAKFGVIGGVSPWLVYSRVDGATVRERLGAEIVDIPMSELIERYKTVEEPGDRAVGEILAKAVGVHVERGEVAKAYRLYAALKSIVESRGLSGFTIKCFDLIPVLDTTACLAVSLFNTASDIIAGCEGDVPAVLAMAVARWLTGELPVTANIVWVEDRTLKVAHCTAPLLGPYSLYTHFESGRGVGIRVDYPAGREATLIKFNSKLDTLRVVTGIIKPVEWSTGLCRTQIALEAVEPGKSYEKLVEEYMGTHYVLVLGNHTELLKNFAELLNIKLDVI